MQKPDNKLTSQILIMFMLVSLSFQAMASNSKLTHYEWVKWNEEDAWLPLNFGRPGPFIITDNKGVSVRITNFRARGAHPWYDYKGRATPYPADRIRYEIDDCIIQLQFPENDIYKNGESRIKGKQIDFVKKSKAFQYEQLKDLGLLTPCYERNEIPYNILEFNHNRSLETFELAQSELESYADKKLSAISRFEINYFDDAGLKYTETVNTDNIAFKKNKHGAIIASVFNSENLSIVDGVNRAEIVTILNQSTPFKMRQSCNTDELVELHTDKLEVINQRIFADIPDNASLITYSEPEGKVCNSLSVNQSKLILIGQIEDWLLIGSRRFGYGWVKRENISFLPVCVNPVSGEWFTSNYMPKTYCRLN